MPDPDLFLDLSQYWAASIALHHGQNPYDPAVLFSYQEALFPLSEPIRMWNPPFVLPIVFLFGLVPFHIITPLWFFLSITLVGIATKPLLPEGKAWRWYEKLLLFSCFAIWYPFFRCLQFGQISPILYFGCAFFFYFLRGKKEFFAGLFLSLTLIKPHLLYLVYLVVFLNALRQNRWYVPTGFALGGIMLSVLAFLIRPESFGEYLVAMQNPPIQFQTPTFGSWLQGYLNIHQLWLRTIPSILMVALVSIFHIRSFSLLVPLSLLTAPYGWPFDQILLMIPILNELVNVSGKSRSTVLSLLVFTHLILLLGSEDHVISSLIWYPAVVAFGVFWLLRSKTPQYV